MEPAVSVQDLAYTYRGQKEPALDGVSLDVALVVGLLLGSAAGEPRVASGWVSA